MTARAPRSGGARLRPTLTDAVLTATLDQLEVSGYERLSMDQVARRAGVGKAALYRRWPGKLDMVIDALQGLSTPPPGPPRSDVLAEVVRELMDAVVAWMTSPRIAALLPDLLAQAQRHPELASALFEQVAGPRRAYADTTFRRWTDPDDDVSPTRELAVDLVAGPIYWRLAQHLTVDDAYLDRLVPVVVGILTVDRSGSVDR